MRKKTTALTTDAPEAQVQAPTAEVVLHEGKKFVALHNVPEAADGVPVFAKHVFAKVQAGAMGNLPAARRGVVVKAGVPCKVRVPINVAQWHACEAVLAKHDGQAPAEALAAATSGDFVGYAIARKWLAVV